MAKLISLAKLSLRNFKGIKDLTIDFHKVTNISGDNGTGKTTIFDAFTWLLFDKDSQDRKDFEIKTLDALGEPLHGIEHEVIGILNVDGKALKLQKVYQEKWTKKRGESEKELTGHETLYYIEDVPVKKSEYQDKISSIMDENIFKLITNPLYFSTNMKWQDRRATIISIVGDVSPERIINYKSDLRGLESLLVDKDIDGLKKSISARRKKLNDDIKGIPPRIDELNNSIQELDFETLDFQRRGIFGGIKDLDEKILDRSKVNDELLKEKDRLYLLKSQLKDMEYKAQQESQKPLQDLNNRLNQAIYKLQGEQLKLESLKDKKEFTSKTIERLEKSVLDLRGQWHEANSAELIFDEEAFVCPTCNRPFEESDIEEKKKELLETFNTSKANQLTSINAEGKKLKIKQDEARAELQKIETEISELEMVIKVLNTQKTQLEGAVKNFDPGDIPISKAHFDLIKQVEELEGKLNKPSQSITDVIDFKEKKKELESELQEINKKLNLRDQNDKFRARIKELLSEEKALAQQIADIEKQEYLCEEFIKTKVELLENSINSKFKYVSFKLFNTQVNGGLEETCEAIINGVPFSNANTASQMNAGLDIINALSDHYGVYAPIFIDNRESVNQLIGTKAQVINLIVSQDKTLKIESEEN